MGKCQDNFVYEVHYLIYYVMCQQAQKTYIIRRWWHVGYILAQSYTLMFLFIVVSPRFRYYA